MSFSILQILWCREKESSGNLQSIIQESLWTVPWHSVSPGIESVDSILRKTKMHPSEEHSELFYIHPVRRYSPTHKAEFISNAPKSNWTESRKSSFSVESHQIKAGNIDYSVGIWYTGIVTQFPLPSHLSENSSQRVSALCWAKYYFCQSRSDCLSWKKLVASICTYFLRIDHLHGHRMKRSYLVITA